MSTDWDSHLFTVMSAIALIAFFLWVPDLKDEDKDDE